MDRKSAIKLLLGVPLLVTNVDELERFFRPLDPVLRLFPIDTNPFAELIRQSRPMTSEEKRKSLQWYSEGKKLLDEATCELLKDPPTIGTIVENEETGLCEMYDTNDKLVGWCSSRVRKYLQE